MKDFIREVAPSTPMVWECHFSSWVAGGGETE
jgi:hypothetical protein